jgi:hypothetical protein
MPVHIEDMTSEVGVLDGELPLSEAQLEHLTEILLEHLERREQARAQGRAEASFRTGVTPTLAAIE